jgi:hypothetical protein
MPIERADPEARPPVHPTLAPVGLVLSPQEMDFIVKRMTTGLMDFATAGKVSEIMMKMQNQANDKALQEAMLSQLR